MSKFGQEKMQHYNNDEFVIWRRYDLQNNKKNLGTNVILATMPLMPKLVYSFWL